MKISNFEDWLVEHRQWLEQQKPHQWPDKALSEAKTEERRVIHSQFPHIVTVEGHYEYVDDAEAWCWDQFGPRDGKCHDHYSFYKRCPEALNVGVDEDNDPLDPPEHRHEGSWTSFWLQKTGYDYGFGDFCFSTEEQKIKFIEKVNEIEKEVNEGKHKSMLD